MSSTFHTTFGTKSLDSPKEAGLNMMGGSAASLTLGASGSFPSFNLSTNNASQSQRLGNSAFPNNSLNRSMTPNPTLNTSSGSTFSLSGSQTSPSRGNYLVNGSALSSNSIFGTQSQAGLNASANKSSTSSSSLATQNLFSTGRSSSAFNFSGPTNNTYLPNSKDAAANFESGLSAQGGAQLYSRCQAASGMSTVTSTSLANSSLSSLLNLGATDANRSLSSFLNSATSMLGDANILTGDGQTSLLNERDFPSLTEQRSSTFTMPSASSFGSSGGITNFGNNGTNSLSAAASSLVQQFTPASQQSLSGAMRSLGLNNATSIALANLMKPSSDDRSSEFMINNEDFPALQGTPISEARSTNLPSSGMDSSARELRFSATERSSIPQKRHGIQTSLDGTVTNIPSGMINDQFGMIGLLTMLRAIEADPTIVSLALGHDLTTLGLNLNAPDKNLHQSFGGPWADYPCRPQDIDYTVPQEYLINATIRDKLAPIRLNRYGEDLLFFLFYNCCGELYQIAAAAELYNRDWRYHKDEKVWVTRAPGMSVVERTNTYERGTYYVFDPIHWRKVAKEMLLEYEKLEEKPQGSSQTSQTAQVSGGMV